MRPIIRRVFLGKSLLLLQAVALQASAAPKIEAPATFLNCQACHLLADVQVGPSLVELAKLYPAESRDYFIEWCINPGKKRPEMPQMPSMAHLTKDQLGEIHDYVLKVTEGVTAKQVRAKTDPFEDTSRPRIVRTFLPDTGPASVLVALPLESKWNLVWDTDQCRLRYLSKGEVDNWPYLRSNGNSLADGGEPIYVETHLFGSDEKVEFLGYRLAKTGLPTFLYTVNGSRISETLSISGDDLVRILTSSTGTLPIVDLSHEDSSEVETTSAVEQGKLTITHRPAK